MRKALFLVMAMALTSMMPCHGSKKYPVPAASIPGHFMPLLEGKRIAVVANQTSMAGEIHLVDFLLGHKIDIRKIFAPEHGFRGNSDAGETIENGKDAATGIPIVSIYGTHLKPKPEDLADVDVVLFDIQDVGVRFYTYLSTLHYVMEACAQKGIECIVLDRPNPNGFYFDGPVLDTAFRSFVGMHPVPVVTGMTIGEYALMINGERWLKDKRQCDLKVIKCINYTHYSFYELPVRPSPNLPDMTSVYLYPSLCFFEGTNISLGRGTEFPFQVYGSPLLPDNGFSFVPHSMPGAVKPPLEGIRCYGRDLRNALVKGIVPSARLNLEWLIEAYQDYPEKSSFFIPYFDTLAGGPVLREQIQKGMSAEQIRATWKEGLKKFGKIRGKYLLYK